jgi:Fe-S-cluster-containing dehydrogenase component/CRP-like cAMP-binding protein
VGQRNRWLFAPLDEKASQECVKFLADKLSVLRAGPGQVILLQDERINSPDPDRAEATDGFYIIRSGFVQVTQWVGWDSKPVLGRQPGRNDRLVVLDCLGPGDHFGEIALLSLWSEKVRDGLKRFHGGAENWHGRRTATCTALGQVELVRVPGAAFRDLLSLPGEVLKTFERHFEELWLKNMKTRQRRGVALDDYVQEGLYQGQSLLVIDQNRCTRCDECTRACVESHADGPIVTRMERRGPLFDRYLVVTSCRSCHEPLCLVECPVDAIHRRGPSLEIQIEDHCIGCGLCEHNCPYDNIKMNKVSTGDPGGGKAELKATTCDQCGGVNGPGARCVSACPHDAIFRGTGDELLQKVWRA